MGGDGTAACVSTFDGGTPALGVAIGCRQGRDDGATDNDVLRVVARRVVILVVEGDGCAGVTGAASGLVGVLGGVCEEEISS